MTDTFAAVQRRLVTLDFSIGTSGPFKDAVDGNFDRLSAVATLAALETRNAVPNSTPAAPPVVPPAKPADSVYLMAAALVARQPNAMRSNEGDRLSQRRDTGGQGLHRSGQP